MNGANPSPELVDIWQRATICQRFPAYSFEDLDHLPRIHRLLKAVQLINLAEQANK